MRKSLATVRPSQKFVTNRFCVCVLRRSQNQPRTPHPRNQTATVGFTAATHVNTGAGAADSTHQDSTQADTKPSHVEITIEHASGITAIGADATGNATRSRAEDAADAAGTDAEGTDAGADDITGTRAEGGHSVPWERPVNLKFLRRAPFYQNGAKSGFEMCFGPSTSGAGAKTRLESRIKEFTPHRVCRPGDHNLNNALSFFFKLAQNLNLGCVFLSDPSTNGAGGRNQNTSRIQYKGVNTHPIHRPDSVDAIDEGEWVVSYICIMYIYIYIYI